MAITTLITTYKIPVKPVMLIIWIVFFPKLTEPLLTFKKFFAPALASPQQDCLVPNEPNDYSKKNLGRWIQSTTTPQQQVLVIGFGSQIQVYSERLSPSIYFNTTDTKRAKKRFFSEVLLNKPAKIVIPGYPDLLSYDIRSFINNLVAKDYFFERCMYGYNIYTHK